jgi:hypothetical protein
MPYLVFYITVGMRLWGRSLDVPGSEWFKLPQILYGATLN